MTTIARPAKDPVFYNEGGVHPAYTPVYYACQVVGEDENFGLAHPVAYGRTADEAFGKALAAADLAGLGYGWDAITATFVTR